MWNRPPTWQALLPQALLAQWCERCCLSWSCGRTRSFLEIGGGLLRERLAKARAPAASVIATDVSPLPASTPPTGRSPAPRRHVRVDAETLPFDDGQFDAVYSQVVLYRLPDPARTLREIRRVLAPGGRYLGIERASPWMPGFAAAEARALDRRARERGTRERAIRYREWLAILKDAGMEAYCLAPVPGGRVSAPWLRRLGNGARQIYVTITFTL